jgi:cold shock CspA family protein/ribosome-associated translation inhibitor RaiA
MRVPLEITYRNVSKSDEIEEIIREKVSKLEEMYDSIISCRISIEQPQEFQRTGNPYRIRIAVRVPPGKELVVRRESGEGEMHTPLRGVINDAFQTMMRQVMKIKSKQEGGGSAKPLSESDESAIVVRIFKDEGYGFVRTVTGREVYFHQNSVVQDDFDRIEVGTGVRIVEQDGEKGPQASTVHIVDKPGSRAARQEKPELDLPEGWKQ